MVWIKDHGVRPQFRRDVELIGFGALLGPPIGGLALGVILGFVVSGPEHPIVVVLAAGLAIGAVLALFSHLPGLIPALLAGAAISVASRYAPSVWARLALAPLLGAAASALWFIPIAMISARSPPPLAQAAIQMAPAILAGAVAALIVTCFVERFGSPVGDPQSPSNSAVDR